MQTNKATIILDNEKFTPQLLEKLSEGSYCIDFTKETYERVQHTREEFDRFTENTDLKFSGVNAGLGFFSEVSVKPEDIQEMQYNIIKSHSCGVGNSLSKQHVRMLFVTRIKNLSMGYSGISLSTFKKYVEAFNKDILPQIPEQGTVGASGDLAPLAHLALGLIGEGKIYDLHTNEFKDAKYILSQQGYTPITLKQKEGLSLINGAQFIASMSAEALLKAENLAKSADIIFSMTFEALNGVPAAFTPIIHEIRNHAGQQEVCSRVNSMILEGEGDEKKPSQMNQKLKEKFSRVQDGYSIRCVPQVHGITHDTLKFLRRLIENELNAVSDNPMVMTNKYDGDQFSATNLIKCGNFHGEYGAKSMDFMAICVQELANISERRIERLVNPTLSKLPAFLTENPGKNCGFMMAHVTAVSLTSENKSLCHPASIDTIPTSANKEDHVSMGGYAVRKALKVIENVEKVLAIELLLGCQALDFNRPHKSTEKIKAIHSYFRQFIPFQKEDQQLSNLIDISNQIIRSGKLLELAGFKKEE